MPYLLGLPILKLKKIRWLEKVQKKAIHTFQIRQGLSYPERLHNLVLTNLEKDWREAIWSSNIRSKWVSMWFIGLPQPREASGGHSAQLQQKVRTSTAQRFSFYKNRIVNYWKKLGDCTVTAPSTNDLTSTKKATTA